MVSQQLIDYIESLSIKGYSEMQIYNHLVKYGYSQGDASTAIKIVKERRSSATQITAANTANEETVKRSGKKPNKALIIVIILILALAIVAGALFFFKPVIIEKFKELMNSQMLNPKATGEEEIQLGETEAPDNPNKPGTDGEQQLEQDVIESEDCGIVDNMRLMASPEERTDEETGAMACFSESLLGCYHSLFELTGTNGAMYEVMGRDGEDCLVSKGDQICRVPMIFIQQSQQAAENEGAPEMAFVTVMMGMTWGSALNTETSETITIECY